MQKVLEFLDGEDYENAKSILFSQNKLSFYFICWERISEAQNDDELRREEQPDELRRDELRREEQPGQPEQPDELRREEQLEHQGIGFGLLGSLHEVSVKLYEEMKMILEKDDPWNYELYLRSCKKVVMNNGLMMGLMENQTINQTHNGIEEQSDLMNDIKEMDLIDWYLEGHGFDGDVDSILDMRIEFPEFLQEYYDCTNILFSPQSGDYTTVQLLIDNDVNIRKGEIIPPTSLGELIMDNNLYYTMEISPKYLYDNNIEIKEDDHVINEDNNEDMEDEKVLVGILQMRLGDCKYYSL